MILYEMLESGKDILQLALEKLFNLVLTNGKIPDPWCISYVKPLHKGGSKKDPNCYVTFVKNGCLL